MHTNGRKMVQCYYLMPGCVISMVKIYIKYQSEYVSVVSTREVALYFGFVGAVVQPNMIFRRTAKFLVRYATSWSLTLSPEQRLLKLPTN